MMSRIKFRGEHSPIGKTRLDGDITSCIATCCVRIGLNKLRISANHEKGRQGNGDRATHLIETRLLSVAAEDQ